MLTEEDDVEIHALKARGCWICELTTRPYHTVDDMAAGLLNNLLETVAGLHARRITGRFSPAAAQRWARSVRAALHDRKGLGRRDWTR